MSDRGKSTMEPGESNENDAAEPKKSKEPNAPPRFLNAAQAAFEIGVTKADIARLREEGKLSGVRGRWGRWYYRIEALSAVFINTPPPEASPEPKPKIEGISLASIMNELTSEQGARIKEEQARDEAKSDEEACNQAPLVRMANAIFVLAIDSGASDIHLEPDSQNLRIRIRVDGVLREIMKVPNHLKGPLIQRYKVMADISIQQNRLPQAGTVRIKHSSKDFDLRVTTMPSFYGENVTMHILKQSDALKGLNKLGFAPEVHAGIERCFDEHPSGLTLIVGPGSSGITTTAYSVLHRLNSVEQKIATLEALPEYRLGGIAQSYYAGPSPSSFSETLRLLPVMDVDTLFLGDINTPEALSHAAETAFSGKRVIATMAATDTSMALWRLSQMGVFAEKKPDGEQARSLLGHYSGYPENLGLPLQQTLRGVLAQRLVRLICPDCKEPYAAKVADLDQFDHDLGDRYADITLFRRTGCDVCRGSGYKGRIGIFEFTPMNDEIAALVALRAPLSDIEDAAKANGMKELREDALAKILAGLTTPEEVTRVLGHPQKSPI